MFFLRPRSASDSTKEYSAFKSLLEDITLPYSLLTSVTNNQVDGYCVIKSSEYHASL